jgi:hypothetical protein
VGPWGDPPPFHMPVFVVTHEAREPLVKQGGTTYTFVTDGIERALEPAKAGGRRAPFRAAGDGRVELERICLAQSGQFTDLRFRVRDNESGK